MRWQLTVFTPYGGQTEHTFKEKPQFNDYPAVDLVAWETPVMTVAYTTSNVLTWVLEDLDAT